MWNLLEAACTELDLYVAEHNSGRTFDNSSFQQYMTTLKDQSELKVKLEALEQSVALMDQLVTYFSTRISNPAQSVHLQTILKETANKRVELRALVSNYR